MMIIGESPAYDPPTTATGGPVASWPTISPFLAASSVSVRSTVLRYSELASEEQETSEWVSSCLRQHIYPSTTVHTGQQDISPVKTVADVDKRLRVFGKRYHRHDDEEG